MAPGDFQAFSCGDWPMAGRSLMQAAAGPNVKVKNTFVDDWEDAESSWGPVSGQGSFNTCPDLVFCLPELIEPDSELSPLQATAILAPDVPKTPEDPPVYHALAFSWIQEQETTAGCKSTTVAWRSGSEMPGTCSLRAPGELQSPAAAWAEPLPEPSLKFQAASPAALSQILGTVPCCIATRKPLQSFEPLLVWELVPASGIVNSGSPLGLQPQMQTCFRQPSSMPGLPPQPQACAAHGIGSVAALRGSCSPSGAGHDETRAQFSKGGSKDPNQSRKNKDSTGPKVVMPPQPQALQPCRDREHDTAELHKLVVNGPTRKRTPKAVRQSDSRHGFSGQEQQVELQSQDWQDDGLSSWCETAKPDQLQQFHSGETDIAPAARSTNRRAQKGKLWCHLYLHDMMLVKGFDMSKKIIGHGGQNTRRIYELTGAKIRLRGRGSGHLEEDGREAPVHLMLAVTTTLQQQDSFALAVAMSLELLQTLAEKWSSFCKRQGHPAGKAPFWLGDLSDEGRTCLQEASNMAAKPQSLDALSVIL